MKIFPFIYQSGHTMHHGVMCPEHCSHPLISANFATSCIISQIFCFVSSSQYHNSKLHCTEVKTAVVTQMKGHICIQDLAWKF